ncbi:mechanosensitive ion channel family protein [Kutzneria albida]|uniref:Mechanosensitive ion channel MscS domain-containing protein n=1 Tax=Kutzneria albida DSM 43870 TaxID=1449976 RepID=W5WAF7_9PSEU|nr:mechanosensitive ion channel domain-containing protein [Kutzneria albida]AHH97927.1 hypothetical protein KALB_4565 [Kutzneria albida DSM 43870]
MTRTEDLKAKLPLRLVCWLLVAVAGVVVANTVLEDKLLTKGLSLGGTALFAIGGIAATRSAATEVATRLRGKGFGAAGSVLSTVLTATGYCVVVLTVLSLIAVPLQQLVVGGAVTGVILGIAAQQTLGNVFAGMMILLVRPFRIGDTIEVRSGALNGPFTGRVRALGLTYVTLAAENGTLLLPNAGVLAAGVTVGLEPE